MATGNEEHQQTQVIMSGIRAMSIRTPYGQISQPNRKGLVEWRLGIVARRGSHPDDTSDMAIDGAPNFRQHGSKVGQWGERCQSAVYLDNYGSAD